MSEPADDAVESIAIIGLGGRLPGARNMEDFWQQLRQGEDAVQRFSNEDLLAAGVDRESLDDPDYQKAAAVVEEADHFDAAFFGYSPLEAETLDPQHRLFLECAWEALEDAGYDPATFPGGIGVFAGCFMNKYLGTNLQQNGRFRRSSAAVFARVFNDKDFLATRVSYLLNLRGPSMTIQTACSTSLVATHVACQSLLSYECDMALVGGVALNVPLVAGYPVIDGGLFSPDGRCRPFDADAQGTVPGYGAALVVLRRLSDAVAARDTIRAVILGSAINNDGSAKVGFTAPSVDAQAQVISAAHAFAGINPETIGYVEAHGTGTLMGDPIEVAGLSEAFRAGTQRTGFCALGSVKANIGHLDAGAGTAGLIRATLALEHGEIPPCANFVRPNPKLGLERTPFYVPTQAEPWSRNGTPRRAGVSSLGVGGTNAHVVLEEPPPVPPRGAARAWQLLPLAAKTRPALKAAAARLADHLETHDDLALVDAAYTLQVGRQAFAARRFAVVQDREDAIATLRAPGRQRADASIEPGRRQVVFLFAGGGTQYPDMGLGLYQSETLFRDEIDHAAELAAAHLGFDLRRYLYPSLHGGEEPALDQPATVLAALVATSYALARLWMAWGVEPASMIGHSLGEYVAACLAGVFTLDDTLRLAVLRGELFATQPAGAMMTVQLSEAELQPLLGDQLSLAAVNAPRLCVASGLDTALDALAATLDEQDVEYRRVHFAGSSHSHMVEPILGDFAEQVATLTLRPPQIPYISCVTGTWIEPEEATKPSYWARHLRQTVRFADGLGEVLQEPDRVLLEVGAGNALSTLAGLQGKRPAPVAVSSLRHPREPQADEAHLLGTVGRLWQAGANIDWEAFHGAAQPRRVPLPTYPFERRRFWIEPDQVTVVAASATSAREATASSATEEDDGDDFIAPRTEREKQLAALWGELLGIERVGVDDDFFALGGHSLMATQLLKKLRRGYGLELKLQTLFEVPTLGALAARLDAPASAGPSLDLAAEAVLDEAITAAGLALADQAPAPQSVLLTGATGFLGAFLCRALLQQTDAEIHCLVRASSAAEGVERIQRNLENYELLSDWAPERIVAVPGDLQQPRLGLDEATYRHLATDVDTIYHCGAWVNFARPYRALKAANVGGTEEILRLATQERLKPVHHVSTLAVQAGAVAAEAAEVLEDDPLPPAEGHDTGYSQSKWVAEQVIGLARERGVPVAVYRPSVVLGDSRSGACNGEDYLTKMMVGCAQLGAAPRRNYPLSVGTADYVSDAIVQLSLQARSVGKSFHVIDPQPLPWNDLFAAMRAAGYEVESLPYDTWRQTLRQRIEEGVSGENVLEPLLGLLSDAADRPMPRFDCRNVEAGLAASTSTTTVTCPPIDGERLRRYLDFFVRRGWLQPVAALVG